MTTTAPRYGTSPEDRAREDVQVTLEDSMMAIAELMAEEDERHAQTKERYWEIRRSCERLWKRTIDDNPPVFAPETKVRRLA